MARGIVDAAKNGPVRVLLEIVWVDVVESRGRLVVREAGFSGSVPFHFNEIPDAVRGHATPAYWEYRRTKKPTELRNQLRWRFKELLMGVRFRADVRLNAKGVPRLVKGTAEPVSRPGGTPDDGHEGSTPATGKG